MLVSFLLISLHIIRNVYMDVKMQRDRLFTSLVMLSCIEEAKKQNTVFSRLILW